MTASAPLDAARDEVLTGEAVALDLQPTGFFLSAVGALIDVAATLAVILVASLGIGWLFSAELLSSDVSGIVTIALVVLVLIVLPMTVETLTRGRSLGRLAVGARIVRLDGGAAGLRHAFIRATVGVLEIWATLGAVALLTGLFTPRAQRLGDLLAGTYSERTRTPPLPPPQPGMPPLLAGWAAAADAARLPDRVARRAARFVRSAPSLAPEQRARHAAAIAAEVSRYVSPAPQTDPETLIRGVLALRRDREGRALAARTARADALSASVTAAPPGFPDRATDASD